MLILSTHLEFEQIETIITRTSAADLKSRLTLIHEQRTVVACHFSHIKIGYALACKSKPNPYMKNNALW